jgi:proteasome assembly chaperone (PAC2) family protein
LETISYKIFGYYVINLLIIIAKRTEVKRMNSSFGANNNNSGSRNKLVVPGAQNAINQMKYEIASEFGVQLGPDATARQNGSVGGEITKRLVKMAQSGLGAGSGQTSR